MPLHLVPSLLGRTPASFDIGAEPIELELVELIDDRSITYLRFRAVTWPVPGRAR
jgi:hypothetical protein